MRDEWMLNVASRERVELWQGEARRLRRTLDAVSGCVEAGYGAPLNWCSETLPVEQWLSVDEIAAAMERRRLRDDAGKIMRGGSASGVVQGYLNDSPECMANAKWSVGSDGEWPFVCNIDFYTRSPEQGQARLLDKHPVEWLVRLLCSAAKPSGATLVRIVATSLFDHLLDARETVNVGALTLAPHGIDTNALPSSMTAYPCPVGMVLVADLDRVANAPASLVEDLLAVDDLLRQAASASS